jgi:hypothetical protein
LPVTTREKSGAKNVLLMFLSSVFLVMSMNNGVFRTFWTTALIFLKMRYSIRFFVVYLVYLAFFGSAMAQRPALTIDNKTVNREIAKVYGNTAFSLEKTAVLNGLQTPNDLFASVLVSQQHAGYVYVGRVNSCRAGGCQLNGSTGISETSEYFDFCIFFDVNARIKQVKVFNYQATHGQAIAGKGWLKQFVGFGGENEKQVGKDVDAISGATISVYAITNKVNESARRLSEAVVVGVR